MKIRFPFWFVSAALGLTALVFAGLGWNALAARHQHLKTLQLATRFEQLRGQILQLDEVLTMSARLAATTGDTRWEQRYRQFEPQLAAAIQEAIRLDPVPTIRRAAQQTDAANVQLVAMEHRALELVLAGNAPAARALLFGPEYEQQKKIYTGGMAQMLAAVDQQLARAEQAQEIRAQLSLAGALVGTTLIAGVWVVVLRRLRRWGGELKAAVAERTAALRESETRFRSLVMATAQVVWTTDAQGNVTDDIPTWRAYTGQSCAQVKGAGWAEALHPEDRQRTLAVWQHAVENRSLYDTEYRVRGQDGEYRHFAARGVPVLEPDGRIREWVGTCTDITERKRTEATHAYLAAIVESSDDAILSKALDGTIRSWNQAATQLFGYSEAEAIGQPVTLLIPPGQEDEEPAIIARLKRGERISHYETQRRRKDGTLIQVALTISPIKDETGRVVAASKIVRDITERKRTEESLARLATAVEQAAETIVITDTCGRMLYANPAFEKTTGYTRAEALGQNPRILKSGRHDAAFYEQLWATISRGEIWHGRLINRRKDGTLYEEEATLSPMRDQQGRVVNYVAVKRDVTREVQLEAQFHQAQKMETVGRLAGGVAHDFNNILTVIIGYGDMLLAGLPKDGGHHASVREIHNAAQHAAALTRQLLAFSRKQPLQPKVLDLGAAVAGIAPMLRRLIGENIELAVKTAPDLGTVKADPGQIEQLLLNLSVNARDAMPRGGRLVIETANTDLDEHYTATHLDARPGEYVVIAVSDTGDGMSEEVRRHLFEPFFTTKPQGKGTGLGLATCHGIVKQSGGHIGVYSEPGQGTTFRIYLPRLRARAAENQPPQKPAALPPGTETILLVEDEPQLRDLVKLVLSGLGYHVLVAAGGPQALELAVQRNGKGVDLLLTDVVMPLMNGRELAEKIRAHQPGVKVLLMSGYTADIIGKQGAVDAGFQLLEKPYTPSKLAQCVRAALDATPAG